MAPNVPLITSASIQVSRRQKGNDLLMKLSRYTFADIEPDFVVGRTACALYLSIRYHAIHPNYIYERINKLGENYDLRILLVVVDHVEHKSFLKELSKLSIRCNLTLMLCWTVEDAAMYLEKYKLSEDRPADVIMEKPTNYEYEDALDQYMIDALAESKSVNRTDAANLVSLFDNFEKISTASPEELSLCPGVGMQKAQRLYELLHRKMKRGDQGPSRRAETNDGPQGERSHQNGAGELRSTGQRDTEDDYTTNEIGDDLEVIGDQAPANTVVSTDSTGPSSSD